MRICTCCLSGCSVHTPIGFWKKFLQATEIGPNSTQPKLVLTLRKIFKNRQTMKSAENSNCSSSNCFDPNLLTRTKLSADLTATLQRTSSLCEGRLHSHALKFPQTLVLFAVLFVDCEAWFYSLAESLPCVRRAISCILFSLEQSQVVGVMVAELLLDSV